MNSVLLAEIVKTRIDTPNQYVKHLIAKQFVAIDEIETDYILEFTKKELFQLRTEEILLLLCFGISFLIFPLKKYGGIFRRNDDSQN